MRSAERPSLVGFGGDEFAVLPCEAAPSRRRGGGRSIVDQVRQFTATLEGNRRRVTASVGVVGIGPDSGQAADLLALADLTMYDAKEAGRDRYVSLEASPYPQSRSGERLEWKARLERAIENDAFVLHLQPILDLSSGRVASAEALIRLDDAAELVAAGEFIDIAERAGLMATLDAWVIEHSIEMLAQLRVHAPDFRLAVNLSGLSIGDLRIEEAIVAALRQCTTSARVP